MSAESLIRTKGKLVNIERQSTASDASGSVVITWASHLAGVKVFIQPSGGDEGVLYGREGTTTRHTGFAKADLDIQATDRLTGASLGTRIMDVEHVSKAGEFSSGRLAHLVLDLQERVA